MRLRALFPPAIPPAVPPPVPAPVPSPVPRRLGRLVVIVAAVLLLPAAGRAQTPAERDAARATVQRHADAIVTILGTARVHVTMGGREAPATEENVVASGVVLDGDGLVVAALSALEPARLMNSMVGRMGAGTPEMNVAVDLSDLRVKRADGTDVPAKVVLRDEDLDLAFLRPQDTPATPWTFVDAPAADVRPMDLLVVVSRLGELAGRQVAGQFVPVMVVIDSPRRLYFAAGAGGGGAAFDVAGGFVGLTALLSKPGAAPSAASPMSMITGGLNSLDALGLIPVVVPIAEIRDVARQAAGGNR
ncbi:MAG: trypsin-like peptidase domain-containing protein [Vicinamibacterales bacterium]